jgi:hypothetical protein
MDPEFKKEFMLNLCRDITNRPYVNWVFNDPSDNHTASCPIYSNYMTEQHAKFSNMKEMAEIFCTKSHALRFKNSVLNRKDYMLYEMRVFDMPRNKRDLKDIVQFIGAWLFYIEERTKRGMCTRFDERLESIIANYGKNPFIPKNLEMFGETAEKEFMDMIDMLGLEWKDYRRFVERNLRRRLEKPYGKNYLV